MLLVSLFVSTSTLFVLGEAQPSEEPVHHYSIIEKAKIKYLKDGRVPGSEDNGHYFQVSYELMEDVGKELKHKLKLVEDDWMEKTVIFRVIEIPGEAEKQMNLVKFNFGERNMFLALRDKSSPGYYVIYDRVRKWDTPEWNPNADTSASSASTSS